MADCSSLPAEFSTAISTFSLGINKNSPSSVFSNPHSSRNSIPPFNPPTLSYSTRKWNKLMLDYQTKLSTAHIPIEKKKKKNSSPSSSHNVSKWCTNKIIDQIFSNAFNIACQTNTWKAWLLSLTFLNFSSSGFFTTLPA